MIILFTLPPAIRPENLSMNLWNNLRSSSLQRLRNLIWSIWGHQIRQKHTRYFLYLTIFWSQLAWHYGFVLFLQCGNSIFLLHHRNFYSSSVFFLDISEMLYDRSMISWEISIFTVYFFAIVASCWNISGLRFY